MTGTTDEATFKALVDQLASVGSFDLIMMSFGSGFSMEDTSAANTDKISTLIEYARSHHLEVGGYDLVECSLRPLLHVHAIVCVVVIVCVTPTDR